MASDHQTTLDLPQVAVLDDFIGHRDGSLVRQAGSDLIAQVVSQAALQGYIGGAGRWEAVGGSFPSGASVGDVFVTATGGTVDGVSFAVGDLLVALVSTPSTSVYAGNWARLVMTPDAGDVSETATRLYLTPEERSRVGEALAYQGDFDASAGFFPSGAALGDTWRVTTGGVIDGVTLRPTQLLIAVAETPLTTTYAGNWLRIVTSPAADDVVETAGRLFLTPDERGRVADAMTLAGAWDPASGSFPASAAEGAVFRVSADGGLLGEAFRAGDFLVALADGAATDTYDGNWQRLMAGPANANDIEGFAGRVRSVSDENKLGGQPDTGQHPRRFRKTVAPGGDLYAIADVVDTQAGKGIGVTGEAVVALDTLVPLSLDAVDQVAFEVTRTVAIADPAGDGVTFGVACFDADGVQLGGDDGFVAVHTTEDLNDMNRTASWYAQISRGSFPSVDVILPAATRYYCPAVRTFGANPGLAVRRCEALPIARAALKATGPDAGGFASFERARAWIEANDPEQGRTFDVMGLKFEVARGDTTVPGLPGARPRSPVFVDHYGQGRDLSDLTHGTAALKAALASGVACAVLRSRTLYAFDETLQPPSDFELIGEDRSATLKQGPNARPGIFMAPGTRSAWLRRLTFDGNRPEAGPYNSFFTGGGITSGSTAGVIDAPLADTAQSVPLTGLGDGIVLAGYALEWRVAGVRHRRIITQDVTLVDGAATLPLNAPLGMAVEADQTFFVKQPRNRMVLKQAYAQGENRITVRAAALNSNANTLLAGYQFAFHENNNGLKDVSYAEIYTLAEDAVAQQVDGVWEVELVLTTGLQSDKVLGQMVTSFQDHENNIATAILALGSNDCGVDGLVGKNCQLHFAQANACIYSPTFGLAPEQNPNINFTIRNSIDYSTEPGNAFGAAHAKSTTITGCWGFDGTLNRNFFQGEQTEIVVAFGNECAGYKSGFMFTGEGSQALFQLNTAENCTINFFHRNISANASWSNNISVAGPNTERGLRLQAGDPDLEDGDVAFKSRCLVSGNLFTGGDGKAVSGDFPASSVIVQPTRLGGEVNDLMRPQQVLISANMFDAPLADAVAISQGVWVTVANNMVNRPGQRAVWADLCERLILRENRVFDAGDIVPAAAYHLRNCVETIWRDNEATVLTRPKTDSGQTWGLFLEGTCTFVCFDGTQMIDGVSGKVNDAAPLSHVFAGFNAGRAHEFASDSRVTGVGAFALADALDAAIRNAGFGWGAGRTITTGRWGTYLGTMADVSDGSFDGAMAIGYNAQARQARELAIGPRDGVEGLLEQTDGDALVGLGAITLPGGADRLAVVRWNGALYAMPLYSITDPNPPPPPPS